MLHFLSHGEGAAVFDSHKRLDDGGQNNSAYSRATVAFRLLQVPKLKGIAQFLLSVYSMVIRLQLSICSALCLQYVVRSSSKVS